MHEKQNFFGEKPEIIFPENRFRNTVAVALWKRGKEPKSPGRIPENGGKLP